MLGQSCLLGTERSKAAAAWASQNIPVYPALGNHELQACGDPSPCLENWWTALSPLPLRPYRWYSVSIGPSILALVLDSDSALKPGSEQRIDRPRHEPADHRLGQRVHVTRPILRLATIV